MKKNWQKIREDDRRLQPFLIRAHVIDAIREFFKNQDFLEVETPLLSASPGMEPYLEVFETSLLSAGGKKRAFLLTSPEYAMKKLLVAGLPKIFTVCKSFRNGEGNSKKHNPEFTILEWYRAQADYNDIMRDCEELLCFISKKVLGGKSISYQGKKYDLARSWERLSVAQAFKKYCGIDADVLLDKNKLLAAGKKRGFSIGRAATWEQIYNQFFLNDIEPHLGIKRPTILYDYPASQAALAKRKKNDPRWAQRFEFYIGGIELGNAFTELTDAEEQRERLKGEYQERKMLGKTLYNVDEDFIAALEAGMPEAGGIAVGVDRLCALFADTADLSDIIFFPVNDLWSE